jgi:transcriptional regulator with XRE-family HTH domain
VQEPVSTRFKKRLRQLRLTRGWTQEQAAEACGIGYKLYQLYELGIKANPGLLTLQKVAKGFGLDVSEFLAPIPRNEIPPRTRPASSSLTARAKRRRMAA